VRLNYKQNRQKLGIHHSQRDKWWFVGESVSQAGERKEKKIGEGGVRWVRVK